MAINEDQKREMNQRFGKNADLQRRAELLFRVLQPGVVVEMSRLEAIACKRFRAGGAFFSSKVHRF